MLAFAALGDGQVVVRHFLTLERQLERGMGELVIAVAECGFPGDVERLALDDAAGAEAAHGAGMQTVIEEVERFWGRWPEFRAVL